MAIQYALYPNSLTDGPEDQRAVVQNQESRTTEDIIDEIINRGSTVTRAEALAVIEEYQAVIAKFVANGDRVNTELMQVSSSISGVFDGTDDHFDPNRHQVNLNFSAGPRLSEATEKPSTEKVQAKQRRPQITMVEDHVSGTRDDLITPGGVLTIAGSLLKYDPEDEEQGVFLLGPDGTETRLGPVMRNKPSRLIIAVPDNLPAGEYELEVRTILRYTTNIRSGSLRHSLNVS